MKWGKSAASGAGDPSVADYPHTTSGQPDDTGLIPVLHDPAPASSVPHHPEPSPPAGRRTVELRLVRVEPYTVTRLAFVVSVALMIVSVVAVAISWMVLAITGVWGQINQSVASLLSDDSASFDIRDYVGFGRVVGATLVLSGVNVILLTGLATVAAHLYNLAAALLGGVRATFTDD